MLAKNSGASQKRLRSTAEASVSSFVIRPVTSMAITIDETAPIHPQPAVVEPVPVPNKEERRKSVRFGTNEVKLYQAPSHDDTPNVSVVNPSILPEQDDQPPVTFHHDDFDEDAPPVVHDDDILEEQQQPTLQQLHQPKKTKLSEHVKPVTKKKPTAKTAASEPKPKKRTVATATARTLSSPEISDGEAKHPLDFIFSALDEVIIKEAEKQSDKTARSGLRKLRVMLMDHFNRSFVTHAQMETTKKWLEMADRARRDLKQEVKQLRKENQRQ